MKQSEALRHLRAFMLSLQRYRSIVKEQLGPGAGDVHLSDKLAAEMWPWVFGNKCPLPALSKIIERVDDGNSLAPMDYYNMMYILYSFTPEIKVAVNMRLAQSKLDVIPDEAPSLEILKGWDEE